MKNAIYLLLILLISCGEELPPKEPGDELRSTQELSTSGNLVFSEINILKQVCNYLRAKDRYFKSNVVNSNQEFDFETQYKDCGSTETITNTVSLSIQQSSNQIKFYKTSGEGQYFTDYEGHEQGLIAPFCEMITQENSSVARYIVNGNKVNWIYPLGTNTTYCPEDINTLCVVVEGGIVTDDDLATITERHSLAIGTRKYKNRQGMIITRILESTDSCDQNNSYLFSKLNDLESL